MGEWRGVVYQNKDLSQWYEVSDDGKLRNSRTKYIVRLYVNKNGYFYYCGTLGSRNKKISIRVHKAVAESFIDNPFEHPAVNHKDGNKLNNNVSNLEWVTNKQNTEHAIANGLFRLTPSGPENPQAKLTKEEIQEIRAQAKLGISSRQIGKRFGVDHSTIVRIVNPSVTRPLYQSVE